MSCLTLVAELEKIAQGVIHLIDTTVFPSNSVIVYDIDNTLIDEYNNPMEPIIKTYNHAMEKGLTPIIISSRTGLPEVIDYTIKQLNSIGITGYKYLYLRPQERTDNYRFKFMCRKDIHERGQYVAMSLGDQPWDMGRYGGIGIQIPTCKHSFKNDVNTDLLNFINCDEL